MKRIACAVISVLFFAPAAAAQPSWSALGFSTTPQNAPQVLAAADALMNSAVGKQFPGKLLLQVATFDGSSPATHSFVPIYKTAAEREAFAEKMRDDPAWKVFQAEMSRLTEPASSVLYRTLKTWGDIVDTDHVWMGFSFRVSDPAAFVAALDKLMASPTGKNFPGQAYLSAVVAGGITPVTHLVSVGYASEAEMEKWNASMQDSEDWAAYLEESRKVVEFQGAGMSRDLKAWGPASLKSLTGR